MLNRISYKIILVLVVLFIASEPVKSQCIELLWEDNFESNILDSNKWNIEIDGDGGGNSELQYYTSRDTNLFISDGTLKIRALKENYLNHQYTSAKIFSKNKGDWKYGRVEAKIKLPEGKGIWPAFWMLPTENKYGIWPKSGEIDIVELVGGGSGDSTIWGTIHVGSPWNYSNGSYTLEDEKFSEDFHLFAIEWSKDTIKWFVDDILYSVKTASDVSHWLPFNEKFYLILNLAVGGNWPGDPDENTEFPQVMEVDYVKVYGKPIDQGIIALDSIYPMSKNTYLAFNPVPEAKFEWSVINGSAKIESGINSPKVKLNWGCENSLIQLKVTYPDCGEFIYKYQSNFNAYSLNAPEFIFQNQDSVLLELPFIDSSTFNWFLPEGVNAISDEDINKLWVKWGCTAGEVGVEIDNSCGLTQVSATINLLQPKMQGPAKVAVNSKGVSYAITELPEALYFWEVPYGAEIIEGQNTSRIKVNFSDSAGFVRVVYDNNCIVDTLSLLVNITDTIVLCDYESTFLEFKGWDDGVEPGVVSNPLINEINSSNNVGFSYKAASPWSGLYGDLGFNLDLSKHNKVSVLVNGPKAGKVLFKLEDVGEGIDIDIEDNGETSPIEVAQFYSNTNSWEYLEFDFTGSPSNVFDRLTLFFDFGSEDTNTYFFDNIILIPSDTIFFTQSNVDEIIEGEENGKHILVKLFYDQFNDTLDFNNWQFNNLPVGVSVGDILLISPDSVILELEGNSTQDYDETIKNFETIISKDELKNSTKDLVSNTGVRFKAKIEDFVDSRKIDYGNVYPNPVISTIQISYPNTISEIHIYDILGNLVFEQYNVDCNNMLLDLNHLQIGCYTILGLDKQNNNYRNKIIKINN